MAEFTYNNSKNANTDHTLFKLNCAYHSWVSFKNKYNVHSRSFLTNGLAIKLRKLMNVYYQNLLFA